MTPWQYFKYKIFNDEGGWIPIAIAAASALAGAYMQNQQSAQNTSAANEQAARNTAAANATNLQISRENTAFQERMSNTAYQRAMSDMEQAGLNPMLAYQQGGAGTPTGSTATMQTPDVKVPQYQDPLSPAVNSAVDAFVKTTQLKQAAQELGIKQSTATADIAMKAAQTAQVAQSAKKMQVESDILNARAKKEKLEGNFYDSESGKTMYYLNKINEAAGGSLDTLNSAKDLLNPASLLKGLINKPKKIQNKLNKKTGEIEQWIP